MNCGTLNPTPEVGAARPSDCGGPDLLGTLGGFTTAAVRANQAMAMTTMSAKSRVQAWTVWPTYPVAAHRITPRPLERSP